MPGSVTRLLKRWEAGDSVAFDELVTRVYDQLLRQAQRLMHGEAPGGSLQAADLVHETYIRLRSIEKVHWSDRGHFLSIAARAMRRLLVDRARARNAAKRGGEFQQVSLTGTAAPESSNREEMLAVHEALKHLEKLDPRQCSVVEMRYFAGLSFEEVAKAIGVSERRAKGIWTVARNWLRRELEGVPQ